MAGLKKSVRLSDSAVYVLGAISSGDEINWSGSITSLSEQFLLLAKHCLPEISEPQKQVLAYCYKGYARSEHLGQELRMMPWVIAEKCMYDKIATNLLGGEAEAEKFIEVVKGWSEAERIAAIYESKASQC